MDNTVKQRIKEFVKYSNITVQKFELRCGMSNGYVNSIKNTIGSDKLESIIREFPNLNQSWLLNGEGEMLSEENTPIIKRINDIIEYKGMNESSFSGAIGIRQNTLNQQLSGLRKLSLDVVKNIIITFEDISPDWLIAGRGEMIKDNTELPIEIDPEKEISRLQTENKVLREVLGLRREEGKSA